MKTITNIDKLSINDIEITENTFEPSWSVEF